MNLKAFIAAMALGLFLILQWMIWMEERTEPLFSSDTWLWIASPGLLIFAMLMFAMSAAFMASAAS